MAALVILIDSAIKGNPDSTGNHRLTDLMCLLCAIKYEIFTGATLNFNVVVRPCSGELEVVFHSVLEALTISEVHPRVLSTTTTRVAVAYAYAALQSVVKWSYSRWWWSSETSSRGSYGSDTGSIYP